MSRYDTLIERACKPQSKTQKLRMDVAYDVERTETNDNAWTNKFNMETVHGNQTFTSCNMVISMPR
jgi:hypothetical protein